MATLVGGSKETGWNLLGLLYGCNIFRQWHGYSEVFLPGSVCGKRSSSTQFSRVPWDPNAVQNQIRPQKVEFVAFWIFLMMVRERAIPDPIVKIESSVRFYVLKKRLLCLTTCSSWPHSTRRHYLHLAPGQMSLVSESEQYSLVCVWKHVLSLDRVCLCFRLVHSGTRLMLIFLSKERSSDINFR